VAQRKRSSVAQRKRFRVPQRLSAAIKAPSFQPCHSELLAAGETGESERGICFIPLHEIHSPVVTSDLAPNKKQAHHSQGKGSLISPDDSGRKSFAVKILTSKSFVVRILPGFSC